MVVILLSSPLQSQYDTNVTPDKKATLIDDWCHFICRFNVGGVSRMRIKEVLALLIYKPE